MSKELCGKWMPRKKATCARRLGHAGDCRTAEGLADRRERKTQRRRGLTITVDPEVRRRWNKAYKLVRYGITQEDFDRLLEVQQYACAMCGAPFDERHRVCIDHDHACCPAEKSSCGNCIRGLLCLSCNTALGHIERKYDSARAYLDSPPGVSALERDRAA